MRNQSEKSVFFPKLTDPVSQDLHLKKEEIIKSLQSQFIRNAFFYRFEHSKTTESKKYKQDRKNLGFDLKQQSIQKTSFEDNTSVTKRRNKIEKAQINQINHSQSFPTNLKQKLTYVKSQIKRKRQPKNNLKFQQYEKISNHFCFSLTNDDNKKYYRSKRKQVKVKTQMEQSSMQRKKMPEDRRISGLLKVKKAAQFQYSLPQEAAQKKQRQEIKIRQCLDSLKKPKPKKDLEMPITSIKGWNSKLESSSEFFI